MSKFILYFFVFLHLMTMNVVFGKDLESIRQDAASAIFKAHMEGGSLFRHSFSHRPIDLANAAVRSKSTYSQFSNVFHMFMSYSKPGGLPSLYSGLDKVAISFEEIYNKLLLDKSNLAVRYERGRIYFDRGAYDKCLEDIQPLIEAGNWQIPELDKETNNEFLLMQGKAQLESSSYNQAIITLTELIKKDPNNKEAYFNRASAYFETGSFDLAVNDYVISEKSKNAEKIESQTSKEFSAALMAGLFEGGNEAIIEFVPSLCNTAYGLGKCLWTTANEPLVTTVNFCNACYEAGHAVTDYVKTLDVEKLEDIADELKQNCNNFNNLSDGEKGQAIGFLIGKYGVDIFAGGAALKCVGAVNKLKNANRLSNLEAIAKSEKARKTIQTNAITHAAERETYFQNTQIHWDKQYKHVPGEKNFQAGNSIFTHEDAQGLLKKYSGRGQPIKSPPGTPIYKERIDFEEIIGYYISKDTPNKLMPTTKGMIHYSKTGAHIVPSSPESF